MDRGNILSGAAFSAVLLSAVAFLVVLMTVGFLTNGYIERTMSENLREEVQTRWHLFAADYQDKGVTALTELIESALLFSTQSPRAIGLFDATGTPIAGNILALPKGAGWQEGALEIAPIAGQPLIGWHNSSYIYRSGPLGDHIMVVGQRRDRLLLINRAVFRTLGITGFVVVLTMLGAGYLFSRKSLRKLEGMEAALAQVSDGDISARVAISPDNDQIDRIAGRMNAHLDSLSRLMLSTRATAAAIAHDLKSPLARAYLALSQALTQIEAGRDPRAEIEDTQAELEKMSRAFDSFLRLARIESGVDGAQFAWVDLRLLLDDLADTYRMVAEDHGQTLIYERPLGAGFGVMGDAAMLQQMLLNLLQNAVTHAGASREIHLRLNQDADCVYLHVADTGPGIPEAARESAFEPFYRIDPSRRTPGSGLGLALVRAIAERHGAGITLSDNAPGLLVSVVFAKQHPALPRVPSRAG